MSLESFLTDCEQEATEAKKKWDDCSMHPNDMCEEVLKLVKMMRFMTENAIPDGRLVGMLEKIINE